KPQRLRCGFVFIIACLRGQNGWFATFIVRLVRAIAAKAAAGLPIVIPGVFTKRLGLRCRYFNGLGRRANPLKFLGFLVAIKNASGIRPVIFTLRACWRMAFLALFVDITQSGSARERYQPFLLTEITAPIGRSHGGLAVHSYRRH